MLLRLAHYLLDGEATEVNSDAGVIIPAFNYTGTPSLAWLYGLRIGMGPRRDSPVYQLAQARQFIRFEIKPYQQGELPTFNLDALGGWRTPQPFVLSRHCLLAVTYSGVLEVVFYLNPQDSWPHAPVT